MTKIKINKNHVIVALICKKQLGACGRWDN